MDESLTRYLDKLTESDWLAAVESLLPDIHEVDRNAVQIWFRFYPHELRKFIESAADKEETKRRLQLLGSFDLADQIDTSHRFLYGHRYWPKVKQAIEALSVSQVPLLPEEGWPKAGVVGAGGGQKDSVHSTNWPPANAGGSDVGLADLVRTLSMQVSERSNTERPIDRNLLNGIILVGLMTLNQVGIEKFKAASGEVEKPKGLMARSPDQIVAERKRDDSQGLFGFLRTVDKRFSIHWTDKLSTGKFQIINDEEIASASARDQSQDWKVRDPRCWEGVVPVECRSASCGTCWIGVLAGQEKLSEVGRRERRQMKVFGYQQPDDDRPFLRLACQAKGYGNASIVIPPWNGIFGKQVYGNVEELELEPVTTAAQKLRETLESAVSDGK